MNISKIPTQLQQQTGKDLGLRGLRPTTLQETPKTLGSLAGSYTGKPETLTTLTIGPRLFPHPKPPVRKLVDTNCITIEEEMGRINGLNPHGVELDICLLPSIGGSWLHPERHGRIQSRGRFADDIDILGGICGRPDTLRSD